MTLTFVLIWKEPELTDIHSPEATLIWRRSQRCDTGTCVEAAAAGEDVAVRDSKDPTGPVLRFTKSEWDAFIAGVREGDFEFH